MSQKMTTAGAVARVGAVLLGILGAEALFMASVYAFDAVAHALRALL